MAASGGWLVPPIAPRTLLVRSPPPRVPFPLHFANSERVHRPGQVLCGCLSGVPAGDRMTTSKIRSPFQGAHGSNTESFIELGVKFLLPAVSLAATALVFITALSVDAAGAVESSGVETGILFQRSCAGCHSGGGNVIQPSATLFKKDLERNGLVAVDDIYNVTYSGKSRMPGFGEKCTPRGQCTFGPRLSEEDIRALAEFVKLQAEQGWTNVPS